MRLANNTEQEAASRYAMKGFAVGIAQWGAVGLLASVMMHATWPWYRGLRLQYKFYIVMAAGLGGGAHKSDRYLVHYERRGRSQLLDEVTKQRYELLYGDQGDQGETKPEKSS
ncbi:hypothetical protein DFQ28_007220 [Apophysomyces sp. BC1034]|nr:hypothetical protein DFQ30_006541 [Apophysomyces sp. BC1015]KAG0176519.1 hypothetical protein DFQ29_006009 [Apophysomyces sp. BC1021]KAG0186839.1 hypothetical protein DFQ28_007220 [Apophysomyces sp. BC1034]